MLLSCGRIKSDTFDEKFVQKQFEKTVEILNKIDLTITRKILNCCPPCCYQGNDKKARTTAVVMMKQHKNGHIPSKISSINSFLKT